MGQFQPFIYRTIKVWRKVSANSLSPQQSTNDLEAETMKPQMLFTSPILAIIIILVESIFAVSLAANSRLSENAVTLPVHEFLANNTDDNSDSGEDPEQVDINI